MKVDWNYACVLSAIAEMSNLHLIVCALFVFHLLAAATHLSRMKSVIVVYSRYVYFSPCIVLTLCVWIRFINVALFTWLVAMPSAALPYQDVCTWPSYHVTMHQSVRNVNQMHPTYVALFISTCHFLLFVVCYCCHHHLHN